MEFSSTDHLALRDFKIALDRAPSNRLADGLSTSKDIEQVDIACNSVSITKLPRDSPLFQELDRAAQEDGQEVYLSKTMLEQAENPMNDADNILESSEDRAEEEVMVKAKDESNQASLSEKAEADDTAKVHQQLHQELSAQATSNLD